MLEYRLYVLNASGHITGVFEFGCIDDAAAATWALTKADGRPMELWRRDHLIRRFSGDEPPPHLSRRERP